MGSFHQSTTTHFLWFGLQKKFAIVGSLKLHASTTDTDTTSQVWILNQGGYRESVEIDWSAYLEGNKTQCNKSGLLMQKNTSKQTCIY